MGSVPRALDAMGTGIFTSTETLRLAELHLQDIFYTPLEARFNRLTRLAQRALGVRVAAIGFLVEGREWFKAVNGWDVQELPIEHSLSAAVMEEEGLTVIEDTLEDERSARHPLVVNSPNFRFYAGYPLRDVGGRFIGALSVFDTEPRPIAEPARELIVDLGELAQRELSIADLCDAQSKLLSKLGVARRQAMLDSLTRVWNRRGGLELLRVATERAADQCTSLGVCMADLDHFKFVNDQHGHAVGDQVLRKVATLIVDNLRPDDAVCRFGGEEFLLVLSKVSTGQLTDIMERIRNLVSGAPILTRTAPIQLTLSIGGVVVVPAPGSKPEELIERADAELYRAKHGGRNTVEIAQPSLNVG